MYSYIGTRSTDIDSCALRKNNVGLSLVFFGGRLQSFGNHGQFGAFYHSSFRQFRSYVSVEEPSIDASSLMTVCASSLSG